MRPGASGAAGCGCPPDGAFPVARKYSPEPGASPGTPTAVPACVPSGGGSPRRSSSNQRRLAVDDAARVRRVRLQPGPQPLVVGPERPRLLLHLADSRLDAAEPGLRTPGPDLLGRVRPGDFPPRCRSAAPAPCRRPCRARRRRPPAGRPPRPRTEGSWRPANRSRIASIRAGAHGSSPAASVTATTSRPPDGPVPGGRQPERRKTAHARKRADGPGEVRAAIPIRRCRTRGLEHERREARTPPGLDEVHAVRRHSPAARDRVAGQRLAPGHGAHQPHQRPRCAGRRPTASATAPPGRATALRIRIWAESRSDGIRVNR